MPPIPNILALLPMDRRIAVLILAVAGLATFFLPLVLIRAPLVGTQKISGWDAVRSGEEKKRSDASLDDALEALGASVSGPAPSPPLHPSSRS